MVERSDYISVVIPAFNRYEYLEEVIKSVYEYADYPFELIVHDDASNPEVSDKIYSNLRQYISTYILNPNVGWNMGLAMSVDRCVSLATSNYILMLNADCKVIAPCFKDIVNCLSVPFVGYITPHEDNDFNYWYENKNTKFILNNGVGGGCLPKDGFIKTINGLKKISDICLDDKVISGKGNVRNILGISSRLYNNNLVEIYPKRLRIPFSLTPDHKLKILRLTRKHKGNKKELNSKRFTALCTHLYKRNNSNIIDYDNKFFELLEIPSKDLKEFDCLLSPISFNEIDIEYIDLSKYLDLNSKIPKNTIPLKIKVSDNFLKLCGYYISEGHCFKAGIGFTFNINEKSYVNDIVSIIKNIFNLDTKTYIMKNRETYIEVRVYNTFLASIFKNLFGYLCYNKHIPLEFMYLDIKKQKLLLDYIFYGDGHKKKNSNLKDIRTTSYTLLDNLIMILLRNNIFPGISREFSKTKTGKLCTSYRIYWTENLNKRYNYSFIYKDKNGFYFWMLPIENIKLIHYEGLVYNLDVEEEHEYLANFFRVNNCIIATKRFIWKEVDGFSGEEGMYSGGADTNYLGAVLSHGYFRASINGKNRFYNMSLLDNGNKDTTISGSVHECSLPKINKFDILNKNFNEESIKQYNYIDHFRHQNEHINFMRNNTIFWHNLTSLILPSFPNFNWDLAEKYQFTRFKDLIQSQTLFNK